MSIKKRANGWQICVEAGIKLDGKRKRIYRTASTKREAQKIERALQLEVDKRGGAVGDMTLSEFIADVFVPQKKPVVAVTTWHMYEVAIRLRLIPSLGNMKVEDIKKAHVQAMVNQCSTPTIAHKAVAMLKTILNMALDMDLIIKNPCNGSIRYPRETEPVDPQRNGVWLTSFEEYFPVINAMRDTTIEEISILGLYCGMRKAEILGANWSDIHFNESQKGTYIRIRRGYTEADGTFVLGATKTPSSMRDIPLSAYAYKRLRELRDSLGLIEADTPIVMYKGSRMSPQAATKQVAQFYKSHEDFPHVTVNSMRHSFATSSIRAGIEVSTVSRWLGHTNTSTTYDRYVKPIAKDLQDDMSKIDALTSMATNGDKISDNDRLTS